MAHAFTLYECCQLKVDLPQHGLRVGARGTIVYVLSESAGAYMVEFPGADVYSSQVLDLSAVDLIPFDPNGSSAPREDMQP